MIVLCDREDKAEAEGRDTRHWTRLTSYFSAGYCDRALVGTFLRGGAFRGDRGSNLVTGGGANLLGGTGTEADDHDTRKDAFFGPSCFLDFNYHLDLVEFFIVWVKCFR